MLSKITICIIGSQMVGIKIENKKKVQDKVMQLTHLQEFLQTEHLLA